MSANDDRVALEPSSTAGSNLTGIVNLQAVFVPATGLPYTQAGTGIWISPQHVLTAIHTFIPVQATDTYQFVHVHTLADGRSTTLDQFGNRLPNDADSQGATAGVVALEPIEIRSGANYTPEAGDDLGILETNRTPPDGTNLSPLIIFKNEADLTGRVVETAGYPGSVSDPNVSDADIPFQLYRSPIGTIQSRLNEDRLVLSDNIDVTIGQSGSPLWTLFDPLGQGEEASYLWGVLSGFLPEFVGQTERVNGGATGQPISLNNYIGEMNSQGTPTANGIAPILLASGLDLSTIPRHALVANQSETASGNDDLAGTDLWEDLVGGVNKDTLEGLGGDDRLFGGDNDDILKGGEGSDLLDGGDHEGADGDTADYSDEEAIIANIQRTAQPDDTETTGFVVLDADRDQRDTLKNIETIVGSAQDDRFNIFVLDGPTTLLDAGENSEVGDILSLANVEGLTNVNIHSGLASGETGSFRFENFERFVGSEQSDTFALNIEPTERVDGRGGTDIVDLSDSDTIRAVVFGSSNSDNRVSASVRLDDNLDERTVLVEVEELIGTDNDDRVTIRNFDGAIERLDGGSQTSSSREEGLGDLLSFVPFDGPVSVDNQTGVALASDGADSISIENFESFIGTDSGDLFTLEAELTILVNGRDGIDTVDFTESTSAVLETSRFNNVEFIFGSEFVDNIWATGGDQTIEAGIGDDDVRGGIGNDKLYGEDGTDILRGGIGNDTLDGGVGQDDLRGGDGFDTYFLQGGDTVRDSDGIGRLQVGSTILTGAEEDFTFNWSGEDGDTLTINDAEGLLASVRNFSDGDLGITINIVEHFDTIASETLVGTDGVIDRFVFERQITGEAENGAPVAQDADIIENFELGIDQIDVSAYANVDSVDFAINPANWRDAVVQGFQREGGASIELTNFLRIEGGGELFVFNVEDIFLPGVTQAELLAFDTAEEAGFIFDDAMM